MTDQDPHNKVRTTLEGSAVLMGNKKEFESWGRPKKTRIGKGKTQLILEEEGRPSFKEDTREKGWILTEQDGLRDAAKGEEYKRQLAA